MYASIRRYKVSSPNELARLVNEKFVPLVSDLKGFEAYYAISAGENVFASVSVFDTEEGAEQSNQLAEDFVAKNAASLITGKYEIHEGDVIAQRVAAHAA
jgi:nucleotide-binding universal stress UspA family protein